MELTIIYYYTWILLCIIIIYVNKFYNAKGIEFIKRNTNIILYYIQMTDLWSKNDNFSLLIVHYQLNAELY
jgi:hypothetical protein